jgi:hypothetical protein
MGFFRAYQRELGVRGTNTEAPAGIENARVIDRDPRPPGRFRDGPLRSLSFRPASWAIQNEDGWDGPSTRHQVKAIRTLPESPGAAAGLPSGVPARRMVVAQKESRAAHRKRRPSPA